MKNFIKIHPTTPPADDAILHEVQRFLAQDIFLNSAEIRVAVVTGIVFLTGTVSSISDKTRATEAAERANGVREVTNNISVAPAAFLKEDSELRQDIRDALFWEPAINQTEIVVSVQDGTAILAGTVDTWLERRLARQKAYQQGTLIVRNHLRVREWSDFEP